MKKFRIFFPLVALILLAACNNDPKMMILANPVAPVLSTPSHATTAYIKDSLAYVLNMDSTGLAETFTGTAANYGVGTTVTYSLQIDKTGDNFANAQTITTATKDTFAVGVTQLYTVVTNATLDAPTGIQTSFDLRVMTTIGDALQPTYSNVITVMIDPLPALKPFSLISTKNLTSGLWYIIGLGDGNWNYSAAGIGVSMFPLSLVSGSAYVNSGAGTFSYTGYFQNAHGFKIVGSTMNWGNPSWGSSNSNGDITTPVLSGSSNNFVVPADGYYTITLNSISTTLSIVPAIAPATLYATMDLSGDFNGWSGTANPMSGFGTTNNHQWYATVTLPTSTSPGIKFNYNSWANSWGSLDFPFGFGVSNGSNIPYTAGTYTVCFNDIDDCYYYIAH